MSIVTGSVEYYGAAVDVLVGVSRSRERVLRKVGHPVPPPLSLRLVIDTGSYATGLAAEIFPRLGITSVSEAAVRTTFTTPQKPELAGIFDVSIALVSGMDLAPLSSVLVLCSPDFSLAEPVHGILGRDILDRCVFNYCGPGRRFQLAF